jgi:hypothetical protein
MNEERSGAAFGAALKSLENPAGDAEDEQDQYEEQEEEKVVGSANGSGSCHWCFSPF